jgi:hypothetical protein
MCLSFMVKRWILEGDTCQQGWGSDISSHPDENTVRELGGLLDKVNSELGKQRGNDMK